MLVGRLQGLMSPQLFAQLMQQNQVLIDQNAAMNARFIAVEGRLVAAEAAAAAEYVA